MQEKQNQIVRDLLLRHDLISEEVIRECEKRIRSARELDITPSLTEILYQENHLNKAQLQKLQQFVETKYSDHDQIDKLADLLPFELKYPELTSASILDLALEHHLISRKQYQEIQELSEQLTNIGVEKHPSELLLKKNIVSADTFQKFLVEIEFPGHRNDKTQESSPSQQRSAPSAEPQNDENVQESREDAKNTREIPETKTPILRDFVNALASEGLISKEDKNVAKKSINNLTLPEEPLNFGEIAVEETSLTKDQLYNALQKQEKAKSFGLHMRIGEILLQQNNLSESDKTNILKRQGKHRPEHHFVEQYLNDHISSASLYSLPPTVQKFLAHLVKEQLLQPERLTEAIEIFFRQRSLRTRLEKLPEKATEETKLTQEMYEETQTIREDLEELELDKAAGEILVEKGFVEHETVDQILDLNKIESDLRSPRSRLDDEKNDNQNNRSSRRYRRKTSSSSDTSKSIIYLSLAGGGLLALLVGIYFGTPFSKSPSTETEHARDKKSSRSTTNETGKPPAVMQKLKTLQEESNETQDPSRIRSLFSELLKRKSQHSWNDKSPENMFWRSLAQNTLRTWFRLHLQNRKLRLTNRPIIPALHNYSSEKKKLKRFLEKISSPPKTDLRPLLSHFPDLQEEFQRRIEEKLTFLENQKSLIVRNEMRDLRSRVQEITTSRTKKQFKSRLRTLQTRVSKFNASVPDLLPKGDRDRVLIKEELQQLKHNLKAHILLAKRPPKASSQKDGSGNDPKNISIDPEEQSDEEDHSPEKQPSKKLKKLNIQRKTLSSNDIQNILKSRSNDQKWQLNRDTAQNRVHPLSKPRGFETEHFQIVTPLGDSAGKEIAALIEATYHFHRRLLGKNRFPNVFDGENDKIHLYLLPDKQTTIKYKKHLSSNNPFSKISKLVGFKSKFASLYSDKTPIYFSKNFRKGIVTVPSPDDSSLTLRRKLQQYASVQLLGTILRQKIPWWLNAGWQTYFTFAEFPEGSAELHGGPMNNPLAHGILKRTKKAFYNRNLSLKDLIARSKVIKKSVKSLEKELSWSFIHYLLHYDKGAHRPFLAKYLQQLQKRKSRSSSKDSNDLLMSLARTHWEGNLPLDYLFRQWDAHVRNLLSTTKPWQLVRKKESGYDEQEHLQLLRKLGRDLLSDNKKLSINHPGAIKGNRKWTVDPVTYQTMHYDIKTTVSKKAAKEVGFIMELINYNYRKLFGLTDKYIPKLTVLIPKNKDQYKQIREVSQARRVVTGGYFHPIHEHLNVYYNPEANHAWSTGRVLMHEGSHQFFYVAAQKQIPDFINEGLAEYMRDARFKGYDQLQLGSLSIVKKPIKNLQNMFKRRSAGDLGLKKFLTRPARSRRFYDIAYGFIHFMMHGENGKYSRRFKKYVQSFFTIKKDPTPHKKLFLKLFPGIKQLEQDWHSHILSLSP